MEVVVLSMMLLGSGGLAGFGVPLPADAGLEAAAPAECLAYFSHQGAAKPDPKSTNHVERLAAEPAVGALVAELNRLADEVLKLAPARDEPSRLAAETLPLILRTVFSRPSVLYVGSVTVNPVQPDGDAGFILHAGDDAEKLRDAALAWEKFYLEQLGDGADVKVTQSGTAELRQLPLPPDVPPIVPPVVWGIDGGYLFVTVGHGEAEDLLKRVAAKSEPAPWLRQLRADAAITRPGDTLYVDVAGIMRIVNPFLQQAPSPVEVRKVIDELGLNAIHYVAVASGLDDSTAVAKLLVGHDENAPGVLSVLDEKPLEKADFAGVPRSADFALVARCDADAAYKRILQIVTAIEPRAVDEWKDGLGEAEEELGFSLERDMLAALGDLWTLYNSPTEGGSLLTGLCVTAAVRDRAKAQFVIDGILKLMNQELSRGNDRPAFVVKKTLVGDAEITYLQFLTEPVPVAPAWCLTDDRLVFAMSPQMVQVHLTRAADAPTLADAPEVARRLATGDVTALNYSDSRTAASLVYSYAQYMATMGAAMLAKETGIQADLSKFPPYTAIGPHLLPSVSVTRRGKSVMSLESYAVGPSLGPAAVVGAGVLLPALGMARAEARVTTAANNLRIMAVAAFSYSLDKGTMIPQAVRDADGKPLLSWRVALLPYIEAQPLYDRFHLDEPWDSPHNMALLAEMPTIYRHPAIPVAPGHTVFQIPRGKGTLYEGDKPPTDAELDRLPIGRGQTVMFVTAAPEYAVEWTKPADVELTADTLFKRLYVEHDGEVQTAMNDGSVIHLSTGLDLQLLLPMFFPRAEK